MIGETLGVIVQGVSILSAACAFILYCCCAIIGDDDDA